MDYKQLIDTIKGMKVSDLIEFSKLLESEFGVVAVAPQSSVEQSSSEKVAEKDSFDVRLVSIPAEGKIESIKIIKTLTGLGLKEAKDIVEGAGEGVEPFKKGINKSEVDNILKSFKDGEKTKNVVIQVI